VICVSELPVFEKDILIIVGQTISQSGNIRFTVGQYWFIIKINKRNYLNIGGNMLYNSRKWRKNIKVIVNYDTFFS
jgi:hypothetical protein